MRTVCFAIGTVTVSSQRYDFSQQRVFTYFCSARRAQLRYTGTCITDKKETAWPSGKVAGFDCADPKVNFSNVVHSKLVPLNQWSFCPAVLCLFEFCFLT